MESCKIIFWDFDGVIKDSNEIKKDAFIKLFNFVKPEIKNKIEKHHFKNLGISRYKKIPLYMKWANMKVSEESVIVMSNKLSKILVNKVSNSKWVNGVYHYLKANYKKQTFILLTATPQKEIELILKKINIYNNFYKIYGSPLDKTKVIKKFIFKNKINKNKLLFIGDSESDYRSALKNKISFLLRKNVYNKKLQNYFNGIVFENLKNG